MQQLRRLRLLIDPRRSFRTRLGLAIASLALIFSLLLSWGVGSISIANSKANKGRLMAQLAYQMADSLDQGIYTYFREIQFLASINEIQNPDLPLAAKRSVFEQLMQTYPDYAWIGLTNAQGQVVVSTNRILEGKDVSERSWFQEGKENITVQDVHEAELLANIVPYPGAEDEPLRFVDISAPVYSPDGDLIGVLGGHLYWEWVAKVRDLLVQPIEDYGQVGVLIVSSSGQVLLAPVSEEQEVYSNLANLTSFKLAQQGKIGYRVETGTNGISYLVGYAPTKGYRNYPGLGWVVLVRQPTAIAFAEARTLQQSILEWGMVLGITSVLIAWWIAGRLSKPIVAIATAADRIRFGDERTKIPALSGADEVGMLSRSISDLVNTLHQQQQSLATLNAELERRVTQRTATLKRLNEQLRREIKIRKQAEVALSQVNRELKRLTLVDSLTQVANRRCFEEYIHQEWRRLSRQSCPLSLVLCDIDFFKAYNDTYGHQAGDECLQKVASAIRSTIKRPADLVARYGGEEFVIILPHTDQNGTIHVVKEIQTAVKALEITHRGSAVSNCVTLSLGIATVVPDGSSAPATLIARADQRLYQAKEQGRDRFVAGSD